MQELNKMHIGRRLDPKPLGVAQISMHRGSESGLKPFEIRRESEPVALGASAPAEACSPLSWAEVMSALKVDKIVVPFDFSENSVRLLQWISSIAEETSARVSVLHVVYPWVPPSGREAPYHYDANKERVETARALLNRLLGRTCARIDTLSGHVAVGRPTDEIVWYARFVNADLIVMAPHGERGLKDLFLSATTERTARRAPCPVLAVPEAVLLRGATNESRTSNPKCRRILVPTDYSPSAVAALHYAAGVAQDLGSEIYVLNFFEFEAPRISTFNRTKLNCEEISWSLARKRLEEWIEYHLDSTKNVKLLVRPGKASVYTLLHEADLLKADLMVFGPREYAWPERLRWSSSTDAMLRNAPCPVLSLRADTFKAGH